MLEKHVEKYVQDLCKKNRSKCVKMIPDNETGIPDRIIFDRKNKKIYFIELKNETNYQLQKKQEEWKEIIEQCGGEYFLIDGIAEAKKFISNIFGSKNNG
jgi:hypothetical protein